MIKRLALALLLAVSAIFGSTACSEPSLAQSITSSMRSIKQDSELALYRQVGLVTFKVLTDHGTGSAVAVSHDRLVTAAHVVMDSKTLIPFDNIKIYNDVTGNPYVMDCQIGLVDVKNDLAYLVPVLSLPHWTTYEPQYVKWGDLVVACGHPMGEDSAVITSGRVADLSAHRGYMLHSAQTFFGNSGGPLFLKVGDSYKLIAVAHMVYGDYTVLSLASNPKTFAKFLNR